jgi:uncharacterized protein (DUF2267 family)
MEYIKFMDMVEQQTGTDREAAAAGVAGVLETFARIIPRDHRRHLKKQLPSELGLSLSDRGDAEVIGLEEFYNRVGARTRLRFHDALKLTHATMRALSEAAAGGEIKDILDSLAPEFAELFKGDEDHSSTVDAHRLGSDELRATPQA